MLRKSAFMAIQISRNQLGSPRPAAQRDLYRDLIVSILIFGLYFLPAQAQASQEESVEFTMIPEPEGGKTIAYPLDTVIQDAETSIRRQSAPPPAG